MIRVVLADDQALVRQGIRGLLDLVPDIEVVGEAADGVGALLVVAEARPDVLLLDIRMPRLDGIGVLKELARRGNLPPTLVLTTFDDGEATIAAVKAGARGIMLKDVSLADLTAAIRSLAAGRTAFQPAMTESLIAALRPNNGQAPPGQAGEPLTPREHEILQLMSGGYSNREIAGMLKMAEGTVKNHVSNVLAKLGARDRTRAVLKAFEHGHVTR